jgi:hypothetical protein
MSQESIFLRRAAGINLAFKLIKPNLSYTQWTAHADVKSPFPARQTCTTKLRAQHTHHTREALFTHYKYTEEGKGKRKGKNCKNALWTRLLYSAL